MTIPSQYNMPDWYGYPDDAVCPGDPMHKVAAHAPGGAWYGAPVDHQSGPGFVEQAQERSRLAGIAERLKDVRDRLTELKRHEEDLSGQLRAALKAEAGVEYKLGIYIITVTPRREFDRDQAAKMLSPDVLKALTVETIDRELAQQMLPPAVYASCQVEHGKATVRIK
jgi:hypothetical protein